MKRFVLFYLVFISLALFTFFGCKNNSTNPILDNIESAEDNAIVEGEYSSIFEFVDDEGENSPLMAIGKADEVNEIQKPNLALLPACATRTIDTINRLITIDFGNTNCLCLDGIYRRGKIIAQFIGPYRQIGSKVVVSLEDYYVNDNRITGIKTIERILQFKWSIEVRDASVTTANGTITWNSERTVERIAGNSTPLNIWDDEYIYTGSAEGVNRKGVEFSVVIEPGLPLKKKVQIECASTFISGKLTIQNDKGDKLIVNYDPDNNEACDKKVEVDINGVKKIIYVR
ncbi:MAG: hypothetical protein HZB41_01460 [Ignavibacteriae bacterium]|nr:hypothetical protein [Ignavibacteriota bacterium]